MLWKFQKVLVDDVMRKPRHFLRPLTPLARQLGAGL